MPTASDPISGIDHVVIGVPDLEGAIAEAEAAGFTVVRAGRHPDLGTANAVIVLDGAYLELVGIVDEEAAVADARLTRLLAAIAEGPGPVAFALGTTDLEALAARARAGGLSPTGPYPGSRVRPDGVEVRWDGLLLGDDIVGLPPFAIHWHTPHSERFLAGGTPPHPNGARALKGLTLAAGTDGMAALGAALGQAVSLGRPVEVGPHTLDVVAGADDDRPVLAAWVEGFPADFVLAGLRLTGSATSC